MDLDLKSQGTNFKVLAVPHLLFARGGLAIDLRSVGASKVLHVSPAASDNNRAVPVADQGAGRTQMAGRVPANQERGASDRNHLSLPLAGGQNH
jgi:hypothetical protein